MSRVKQARIDESITLDNVYSTGDKVKNTWSKNVFDNSNPIVLELACGWGQYTLNLAEKHPEKNFIGVDKKGDRIWQGAKKALSEKRTNVAFIRTLIEKLEDFFAPEEISEIWITFPDPFPKPCKSEKRLTSERFIEIYKKILKKPGIIHLKTDNQKLFEYSLETIKRLNLKILELKEDVHSLNPLPEDLAIKTFYEEKFSKQGFPIKYVKFLIN